MDHQSHNIKRAERKEPALEASNVLIHHNFRQFSWSQHEIASWLADHGGQSVPPSDLIEALCERLVSAGYPIFRVFSTLKDLHPQISSRTFLWEQGRGCEEVERFFSELNTKEYLESPVYAVNELGISGFRKRLDKETTDFEYPLLEEIRDAGGTDYVAMPLTFSDGTRHFWSWTTNAKGGFTTQQLTFLYDLMPLVGLRLELENARHVQRHLLETYLGRDAAGRVMGGSIHRGEGEEIDAIVVFTDLRGFTRMTDSQPPKAVIKALSAYYEAVAVPIQERGGDILKMVGDGLLAIFPLDVPEDEVSLMGCRTVSAARDAMNRLANLPSDVLPHGIDELKAGLALHTGRVTYGNIGAPDRLDFTVIGPAVNEVVRVEQLAKRLEKKILVTSAFADLDCPEPLVSLGIHALRGVREPKEVFALKDD